MVEKKTTIASETKAEKAAKTSAEAKKPAAKKAAASTTVKAPAKKASATTKKPAEKAPVASEAPKAPKVAAAKAAPKKVVQEKKVPAKKAVSKAASKYPELTDENSVLIEQYRSSIRQPQKQRVQIQSLGLGRIGKTKRLPRIPSIEKLIDKLKHIVRIVK